MEPLQDPEGHRWERPLGDPCPNCQCCTKRLCQAAAAAHVYDQNCAYHGDRSLWEQLVACPCPRANWTDAQRAGDACVHCGQPVNRTDPGNFRLVGMNGGLVATCRGICARKGAGQ